MNDELPGFAIDGARATFRPSSRMSFDDAVAIVRRAIETARANRTRELLVDTRELTAG